VLLFSPLPQGARGEESRRPPRGDVQQPRGPADPHTPKARGTMPEAALTPEELRRRAERLPRVRLAHLPTPLEEAPRCARRLGGPRVFLKRDDCTGMLFGGNKTRHNEFLMADALRQGADVIVWGAGVQSNNCR